VKTVSDDDGGASTPQVVHRWLGIVGLFVAPTTVITSVCFYFGYVYTRKFYGYFGIDPDALGFAGTDYVSKSVSVLFGPIVILLLGWLALLWAGQYARRLANDSRRTRQIRTGAWAAITIGGLIALRGIVGVVRPQLVTTSNQAVSPLALAVGTVSVLIGCWLLNLLVAGETPRPVAAAERVSLLIACAVIVLALFWLTRVFADAYGENQARITAGKLWSRETGVVLDTSERLDLPADQIVESKLGSGPAPASAAAATGAITYRYKCFRSLVVHGDQWVLVPARWLPQSGYAVIVTDDSSTRISVVRKKGIADTDAANWYGGWQCPEVGP
jgi:hypothetical protein